ncbi:TRAPP trafficking subunit Trs65-domain-containing protein [Auriculariales sp. MPI-PUGE-AT-0066]|nr:TRAPP trafficking subunit Trs65-domain-containing protein [Auriculariales sp. MPI-PUGE-AT-0066]
MASLEDVFHACQLALHVPDSAVLLPNSIELEGATILEQLQRGGQREQAFFDERLFSYLSVSFPNINARGEIAPSPTLLQFLSHLAVTLDASYVGRAAIAPPEAKNITHLTLPPHVTGTARPKLPRGGDLHPSIFPPATPNPIPQSDDHDIGYIQAEAGVPLHSFSWGEGSADDTSTFSLLRADSMWVAVYRLDVTVAFVRNIMRDPLLCLTASATMRDKPVPHAPQRQALFDLTSATSARPGHTRGTSSVTTTKAFRIPDDSADAFEEVNLLEGLSNLDLDVPTSRIGPSLRKESYALPSRPPSPPPESATAANRPLPTLRKSFRKTLATVSGFSVKMRSVLSPAVVIPGDPEDELEAEETGSEERTIVLCVELENTGESKLGFQVDNIAVTVSGEGARAKLIAWGEQAFERPESVFPLRIGAREQFNLLYAVSFLRPEEQDNSTIPAGRPPNNRLLRSVSIAIRGRPFEAKSETDEVAFPSLPFVTRWSCTLNLQGGPQPASHRSVSPDIVQEALPAPPSPFPTSSPRVQRPIEDTGSPVPKVQSPGSAAALKRHTMGAGGGRLRGLSGSSGRPMSLPASAPPVPPMPPVPSPGGLRAGTPPVNKFLPAPPSLMMPGGSPIPSPLPSPSQSVYSIEAFPPAGPRRASGPPPPTPAYPAYPDTPGLTPRAFSPMTFAGQGQVGPSVEARRERVPPNIGLGMPLSPLPLSPGMQQYFSIPPINARPDAPMEPVVVSIGLVAHDLAPNGKIYAISEPFYLDVFVFNQTSRVRRFELSHPDHARHKHHRHASENGAPDIGTLSESVKGPGILPLENRIRIGPLQQQASQSVRFPFIALHPGVHNITSLRLTDVDSGFSINMRSIMEVVVHEAMAGEDINDN